MRSTRAGSEMNNDKLNEIVREARLEFERISLDGRTYDPAVFTDMITRAMQEWAAHACLDLITENQQLRQQLNRPRPEGFYSNK